ncbi:MAG TPA: glycosyltransferase [Chloroflexia bacterium]|nr:glycosyltransferase [Chloroflexia bacterium]
MTIGLVFPGFAADESDWCIPAFTNLARVLAARPDIELHIYTLRYPHRHATYRLHGATVHAFGGAAVRGRRVRGASLGLLWADFLASVAREHRRGPFALLHGFWATESGYLATVAARRLGIPALVHLAGGELAHLRAIGYGNQAPGLARLLVARSLRAATAITVPSAYLQAQLAARYPQHLGKAVSWAPGVDTAMFVPADGRRQTADGSARDTRLVQVASLIPVKDQAWLLAGLAAARAAEPAADLTLTLAGSGPLRGALQQDAARLGIAQAVRLVGAVDHGALPALYQAHDAFVLTSRHEAQCMAVLEAASCGLPWVGPPVGALADLAPSDPPSGWSVPPGDVAALAAAMRAVADPAARGTRGTAAAGAVRAAYDLEGQADLLLGLYRMIVAGDAH